MNLRSVSEFLGYGALLFLQSTNVVAQAPGYPPEIDQWVGFGGNIYNNRWNTENTQLSSKTIDQLQPHCRVDYPSGILVTPTVIGYIAYYPTANGSFYAFNYATCQVVWQINVASYINVFAPPTAYAKLVGDRLMSKSAPQIDEENGIIYFGTTLNALLIAADLQTGEILGSIQVNDHPLAILTQSPTLYKGMILIGVSSMEEDVANQAGYECCSFTGSFSAYTFDPCSGTFTTSWTFKTLPEGDGWSGGGIWGSQASIDPSRNQVFIGVGNAYTNPTEYDSCIGKAPDCLPDNVYIDSVVAIDIATGQVNWKFSNTGMDVWNFACASSSNANCRDPQAGIDGDFGMAPTFVPAALGAGTTGVDSVIIGQKNGHVFSFNAANGNVQWAQAVGSGTSTEFLVWGIAADASQVYFTIFNSFGIDIPLHPSGDQVSNSVWGALSLKTGEFVWETEVPNGQRAEAPPSVLNDLVLVATPFVGTGDAAVYALSKVTGSIVYSLPFQGAQLGGVMARGGFVLFGTGSSSQAGSLYVYGLPDSIAVAKADPSLGPADPQSSCSDPILSSVLHPAPSSVHAFRSPLNRMPGFMRRNAAAPVPLPGRLKYAPSNSASTWTSLHSTLSSVKTSSSSIKTSPSSSLSWAKGAWVKPTSIVRRYNAPPFDSTSSSVKPSATHSTWLNKPAYNGLATHSNTWSATATSSWFKKVYEVSVPGIAPSTSTWTFSSPSSTPTSSSSSIPSWTWHIWAPSRSSKSWTAGSSSSSSSSSGGLYYERPTLSSSGLLAVATSSAWKEMYHELPTSSSSSKHSATIAPSLATTSSWKERYYELPPSSSSSRPWATTSALTTSSWKEMYHEMPMSSSTSRSWPTASALTTSSWKEMYHELPPSSSSSKSWATIAPSLATTSSWKERYYELPPSSFSSRSWATASALTTSSWKEMYHELPPSSSSSSSRAAASPVVTTSSWKELYYPVPASSSSSSRATASPVVTTSSWKELYYPIPASSSSSSWTTTALVVTTSSWKEMYHEMPASSSSSSSRAAASPVVTTSSWKELYYPAPASSSSSSRAMTASLTLSTTSSWNERYYPAPASGSSSSSLAPISPSPATTSSWKERYYPVPASASSSSSRATISPSPATTSSWKERYYPVPASASSSSSLATISPSPATTSSWKERYYPVPASGSSSSSLATISPSVATTSSWNEKYHQLPASRSSSSWTTKAASSLTTSSWKGKYYEGPATHSPWAPSSRSSATPSWTSSSSSVAPSPSSTHVYESHPDHVIQRRSGSSYATVPIQGYHGNESYTPRNPNMFSPPSGRYVNGAAPLVPLTLLTIFALVCAICL
jgi:hypothetical protein